MRIVNPTVEIWDYAQADILKHIERCGRVCYKSEDKITEGSAEKFVAGIIKRGHEAVLEHGTLAFEIRYYVYNWFRDAMDLLRDHGVLSYLNLTGRPPYYIISGNIRAWRDFIKACEQYTTIVPSYLYPVIRSHPALFPEWLNIIDDVDSAELRPLCDGWTCTPPDHDVHKYYTVKFVCDRGISHEIVRHRLASYCQESTRYCNYSKEGFGGEITVVKPNFIDERTWAWNRWKRSCEAAEMTYFDMLDYGMTPQQARCILPNSLKTEVVMTANLAEWKHFLKLRCSAAAHPQMREVARMVADQFLDRGILQEDYYA